MLTGGEDGIIRIWDVQEGELLRALEGPTANVSAAIFNSDGTQILAGYSDATLFLWDIASGEILRSLEGHSDDVHAVTFLPDGQHILTADDPGWLPGEIILWDLATGEIISRFGGNLDEEVEGVQSMAVSPNGRTALVGYQSISAFDTHPAALWDIESGEVVRFMSGTADTINSVTISPDWPLGLWSFS